MQTNQEVKSVTFKRPAYPQVLKDAQGNLTVIYSNRVEYYKLTATLSASERTAESGNEWTPEHEAEMCTGNGYKHIQAKIEKEIVFSKTQYLVDGKSESEVPQ